MADDGKRSVNVCVKITEQMEVDLFRLCAVEDRAPAGYLFKLLRSHLYGNSARFNGAAQITSDTKVIQGDE